MSLLLRLLRALFLLEAEEDDGQGLRDQPADDDDGQVGHRFLGEAKVRIGCSERPRRLLQRVGRGLACVLVEEQGQAATLLALGRMFRLASCHTMGPFLLCEKGAATPTGGRAPRSG